MAKKPIKKKSAPVRTKILRVLRYLVFTLGIVFMIMLLLAATTVPFYAWHYLGVEKSGNIKEPDYIVLLGGSSIPSENGLLRTFYTSRLSEKFPKARIVIAIPGKLNDMADAPHMLENEIVRRTNPSQPVLFINKGANTREQALEMSRKISTSAALTLVTSPEHMYRAVLTFRKAGFTDVSGLPTFEQSLSDSAIFFNDKELQGNKRMPAIGKNLQVRYQFWHHLKLEVIVIREYFAITYYKLRGWI